MDNDHRYYVVISRTTGRLLALEATAGGLMKRYATEGWDSAEYFTELREPTMQELTDSIYLLVKEMDTAPIDGIAEDILLRFVDIKNEHTRRKRATVRVGYDSGVQQRDSDEQEFTGREGRVAKDQGDTAR